MTWTYFHKIQSASTMMFNMFTSLNLHCSLTLDVNLLSWVRKCVNAALCESTKGRALIRVSVIEDAG